MVNGASHPDARQRLEAWAADIARDPGPVNHRIRAVRCLLRFAEDMLRAEVRLANAHEDVPLPGETEKQILDGLLETELGLKGVAAARTFGRPKKLEKAACREAERRTKQVDAALFAPESAFAQGFNASGGQGIRGVYVRAQWDRQGRSRVRTHRARPTTVEIVRVNGKPATVARRRRG